MHLPDVPLNIIAGDREAGDGALIDGGSCPVGEDARADFPRPSQSQIDRAVSAAERSDWPLSSVGDRTDALVGIRRAIADDHEAFAQLICAEIGAPISFARAAQVDAALAHLDALIKALPIALDEQRLGAPEHRVRYEPVGVSALITPWNWPLNQVVLKLGAALAAGCPVILKPSELAPRTAGLLCELIDFVPQGTINLLVGDGQTGAALAAHEGVRHVSFTGSTSAGREVALAAASRFAGSTLELGGKSANLLFADCDLETAIRQGVAHCVRNAGQSCNAASRMLVEDSIYERALDLIAARMDEIAVDLPERDGPHIGPQVSRDQWRRVQHLIEIGMKSGTRCIAGGPGRPMGLERGYFSRPTAFADVTPDNTLFATEVFGPVLIVTPFTAEEHAVELANATPYGLAAYVQTSDPVRADRVSRALRAGMVQVNGTSRAPGAPFGGVKASGWGREAGLWGIRAFQEIKSISGASAIPQNDP